MTNDIETDTDQQGRCSPRCTCQDCQCGDTCRCGADCEIE